MGDAGENMVVWNLRLRQEVKDVMLRAADLSTAGSLAEWARTVLEEAARQEILAAARRQLAQQRPGLGLSTIRPGGRMAVCRHPHDARAKRVGSLEWECVLCGTRVDAP